MGLRLLARPIARALMAGRSAVYRGYNLNPRAPATVRLDRRPKHDRVAAELCALVVRPDPGLADVPGAFVAEHEHAVVDAGEPLARPVDCRVLDLEQVGKIGAGGDRDLRTDAFVSVIQQGKI